MKSLTKKIQKIYKSDITIYKGNAKVDYTKDKTVIHVNNEKNARSNP